MKVKGLDGRVYNWSTSGCIPMKSEQGGSSYHERCRRLLASLFPLDQKLEEVGLPGTGGLTGDFYLPGRALLIEVHGRQHYEFVMHFHKTRLGFIQHKQRDTNKQQWCELNNIDYIELPYNESDEQWAERIIHRGKASADG